MQINIKTYNRNVDKFIKDLMKQCDKFNINLILSTTAYVKNGTNANIGIKTNGFFDAELGNMAVAIGKPMEQWLHTLVHESCHLDQYLDKDCKEWKRMYFDDTNACTEFFNWLEKEESLTIKQIYKYAGIMRNLELDCERRTIKKIKKYKLPIDIKIYAKQAGAYISFYNYLPKHAKWYKIGKEPYNNLELLKLMPSNLKGSYTKLNKKVEKLLHACV